MRRATNTSRPWRVAFESKKLVRLAACMANCSRTSGIGLGEECLMPWCGEAMKEFRQGGMQGASRACLIFHLRPCVVSTGVLARGHDIPKVRVESGLRCIAGALRLQLRPAERSRGLHPPGVAAKSRSRAAPGRPHRACRGQGIRHDLCGQGQLEGDGVRREVLEACAHGHGPED